jgi:hypothetical protein
MAELGDKDRAASILTSAAKVFDMLSPIFNDHS